MHRDEKQLAAPLRTTIVALVAWSCSWPANLANLVLARHGAAGRLAVRMAMGAPGGRPDLGAVLRACCCYRRRGSFCICSTSGHDDHGLHPRADAGATIAIRPALDGQAAAIAAVS